MDELMVPTLIEVGVLILVAALFGVLHRRIAQGRLDRPPNGLSGFGVRIPSTLRSDAAWRNAHQAIRPLVALVAVESAAGALLTVAVLAVAGAPAAFVVALVTVGVMIVLSLIATVWAHRVAVRTG